MFQYQTEPEKKLEKKKKKKKTNRKIIENVAIFNNKFVKCTLILFHF